MNQTQISPLRQGYVGQAKLKTVWEVIIVLAYGIGLLFLLWSVILSGYKYRFDADELFNANVIYLMSRGMRPYADFYVVYSPIFHELLRPLFNLVGFNFQAVSYARIVMIILFFIRSVLMFVLVKKVFGKKTALVFLPLFLLNPFTVFAEMQIRPENLMMVIYTLSLLVFIRALEKQSSKLFFSAGVLIALAFLINIKIIPSLVAFGVIFVVYSLQSKRISQILYFINGFSLMCIAFFIYFFIKGYAAEMFLLVFLDSFRQNNAILYPTTLNYFYFTNPVIYGHDGKALNWMYAWSLPLMAYAGGYRTFVDSVGNRHACSLHLMKIILFLSLVLQWVSMYFIHSVFIQYYIPLSWLFTLFAAVLISDLMNIFTGSKARCWGKYISYSIFTVLFLVLYYVSITGNINRSKMDSTSLISDIEYQWKQVLENTPTFPNLLFRPAIYPILWGSTFATYMRDRYPPVYKALQEEKVKTLVGLDNGYFALLDLDSQIYITDNYTKDKIDPSIWYLKKSH